MEPKTYNYILFIFAKSNNQDILVRNISEEIALITKSRNMRYYYGPESCVCTFSTIDDFNMVSDYVDIILNGEGGDIFYFLLPLNTDNLSYNLPKGVPEHLFIKKTDEITDSEQDLVDDELSTTHLNYEMYNYKLLEEFLNQDFDEDEEDDEISKMIKRNKVSKTDDYVNETVFNGILDKINQEGMSSLTEKELSLLNKYRQQISK